MKKLQKGFTLIELMIVVAIIGILAAVAIPAYQDYIVKAKLAKVASTMDPIKTALGVYFTEYGGFPQQGTATNPETYSMSNQALGTTNGQDVWSSVGFTNYPTLPIEVAQLNYQIMPLVGTAITSGSVALNLQLQRIKASAPTGVTAIDQSYVTITPSKGVTAGAAAAPGTAVTGATSLIWLYACTSTDVVLQKYFNNSGALCVKST